MGLSCDSHLKIRNHHITLKLYHKIYRWHENINIDIINRASPTIAMPPRRSIAVAGKRDTVAAERHDIVFAVAAM